MVVSGDHDEHDCNNMDDEMQQVHVVVAKTADKNKEGREGAAAA